MEEKPFGAGAMRECFAMKKLSTFAPHRNWEEAQNMVVRACMCVCVCHGAPTPADRRRRPCQKKYSITV